MSIKEYEYVVCKFQDCDEDGCVNRYYVTRVYRGDSTGYEDIASRDTPEEANEYLRTKIRDDVYKKYYRWWTEKI